MDILNKKAKEFIVNYIKREFNRIDVSSGLCRFNYQCHMNTVHDALENDENVIILCFYIVNDLPILHFLNMDKNTSRFIDNTLGQWSQYYDYYFIEVIYKEDFLNVNNIFIEYRKMFREKLPFWIRLLSNYNC